MFPQRIEHLREFACELHDGHLGAAAFSDLFGPLDHAIIRPAKVARPGSLSERPSHLRRTGARESAAPGAEAGGLLAWDQAHIRRDAGRIRKSIYLVDGGDEARRRDGANTRHCHQALHALIVGRQLLKLHVSVGNRSAQHLEYREEAIQVRRESFGIRQQCTSDLAWEALRCGSEGAPRRDRT